jgi:hypothetical protein
MTILTNGETMVDITSSPWGAPYISSDDVPVGTPRRAITRTTDRDVYIDPTAMDLDQPYGYRLDGVEHVVYRRADGRLDFYELPSR